MPVSTRILRIASANLLRGQNPDRPVADVTKRIIHRWWPHIIGLQESSGYIPRLAAALADLGYEIAVPPGAKGAAANNPIAYDPAELMLARILNFKEHDGKAGQFPARYTTSAEFEWVDGSTVWYNNTHLNSHIEHSGKPYPLPRVGLSTAHIRSVANRTKGDASGSSLAFLGGDFNVDEDADNRVDWSGFPNQIFREVGIVSVYDELRTPATFDTHGSRKIDVIASYKGDSRVVARWVERTEDLFSDHYGVCAGFDVSLLRSL